MSARALVFWLIPCSLHAAVRLGSVHQYGGSEAETVAAMARDVAGNLYLTGKTNSYDFPATVLQLHPGGSNLWRSSPGTGPSSIYSHLASVIFSVAADRAHPGVLFLWTNHGLLRSSDYGNTWTAGSSGLPDPTGGSLAVDPRDGRTLYLADTVSGIFKSMDAGATWTASGAGIAASRARTYPDRIFLDPWNPAVVFAAQTFDGPVLYRSADSGATWQLQSAAIASIAFDPIHQGVAYGGGGNQLLRSVDDGATWSALAAPASTVDLVAVDSRGSVYYSEHGARGVTVSGDGGATWTNHPFPGFVEALAADPDSAAVYLATDNQLLSSIDGFATTSRIAVPAIVYHLGLAPSADSRAPDVFFAITAGPTADAYVMKLDPSGNQIWATYLGGSQEDGGTGIAVDGSGNVYITGFTASSDFPSTPGALTNRGGPGNFVAKISGDGQLLYSASFADGGVISGIAVDTAGNAYLAGTVTDYLPGGFFSIPVTSAAACKLDVSGSQLLYCAKLSARNGIAIAADADGSAYVGGDSSVWKLSPGGAVVYQHDLKGTARALALDSQHTLYVAGNTVSPDFPATPGAFQQGFNTFRLPIAGALVAYSADHGFVTRLSTDTGDVLASTLLEGENWEHALALAVDPAGNLTVGGATASNSFPLLGAFQTRFGYYSGFVSRLSGDLSTLLFSTYVGDSRNFQVSGVAVADDGRVLFAGDTSNASSFFGSTSTLAASSDIFVVDLELVPAAPPVLLGVTNPASQVGTPIAPNQSITVLAAGAAPDATVLLDGQPLQVLQAGAGSIVAQIPSDSPVAGAHRIQVQSGGLLSDPLLVAGSVAAPAIYTQDGSGRGEALVFHEDGTLNSPGNPAAPGSIIAVACNGVGRVTFDGDYAVAATPVSVYVDGFYADGVDAHMVQLPGIPGDTYVIRVYVPNPRIPGFKMPPLVSLTLNIGGTANASGILSQADVAISIQQ